MADLQKLKTEIEKHKGKTPAEVASLLNEPSIDTIETLGTRILLEWGAQNGRAARIRKMADDPEMPDDLRSIAIAADLMLRREDAILDLNNPVHRGMVQALIAAKALGDDDLTELQALAAKKISRADSLGLGVVLPGEIEQAEALP